MTKRLTQEQYLEKAKTIHGGKYDYADSVYVKMHAEISILCRDHGAFNIRACDHIHQKQGCPACAHNYRVSKDEFQARSSARYGSKFKVMSFAGNKHPAVFECCDHGAFEIRIAESHLQADGCCPTCTLSTRLENLKTGNSSAVERAWLDELGVPLRQHRVSVNGKSYVVDGFDPVSGTVYEFYGSYWHGNPERYPRDDVNPTLGVSYGELHDRTRAREQALVSRYKLVTRWG